MYNVRAVEKKMIKCCFTKSLARCNEVLITAYKNQHENDEKSFIQNGRKVSKILSVYFYSLLSKSMEKNKISLIKTRI